MKEMGRYHQLNMQEAVESYTMALFTRVLGWTSEEVRVFQAQVKDEMKDRSLHLYTKFIFVYGQKDEGE